MLLKITLHTFCVRLYFILCLKLNITTVGFETEGQNNVFEKFDGKQTSLLFSAASKVPINMRTFGQQMRNAVAQPSHTMSVAKNIGFVDYAVNSGLFYPACKLHSAISR